MASNVRSFAQLVQPGWASAAGEVLNALVRPILAIMFGATIVYMAVVGSVTSGEFLGIAAVVIGFFFQARQAEKAQERLEQRQDQLVDLAKQSPPDTISAGGGRG